MNDKCAAGCGRQRDYPGTGPLSPGKGNDPAYAHHYQGETPDQPGLKGGWRFAHFGGWAYQPGTAIGGYPAAKLWERSENLSFRNSRSNQSSRNQMRFSADTVGIGCTR